MTPKAKATIALEALDAACKHIQDQLGVDDGGVAAIFFSGEQGQSIVNHFLAYINVELDFKKETV